MLVPRAPLPQHIFPRGGAMWQAEAAAAYPLGAASRVVSGLLRRGILCSAERAARGCWAVASGWGGKGLLTASRPCPGAFPKANTKSDFAHTPEKPVGISRLWTLKQLAAAGVGIAQKKG